MPWQPTKIIEGNGVSTDIAGIEEELFQFGTFGYTAVRNVDIANFIGT